MRKQSSSALFLFFLWCFFSCTTKPDHPVKVDKQPEIYPDYIGVTIPADIAPLCFCMADEGVRQLYVSVKGSNGGELTAEGQWADFDISDWRALTRQNKGGHGISIRTSPSMSVTTPWMTGGLPIDVSSRDMR